MFLHTKMNEDAALLAADEDNNNQNLLDFYQPRSDETRKHYESLLTRLRKLGADNANDISSLEELADDVIDICKNVDIAFVERRKELEDLIGISISADDVRQISQLCEKLDDYVQSTTRQTLLERQRRQQQQGEGDDDDDDTDDEENDDAASNKKNKLFNFSVNDGNNNNKVSGDQDDNDDDQNGDFVDDVLGGGDYSQQQQQRNKMTKTEKNN